MKCPNCATIITCNCTVRVASDGKEVCANCIDSYEYKIKVQAAAQNQ